MYLVKFTNIIQTSRALNILERNVGDSVHTTTKNEFILNENQYKLLRKNSIGMVIVKEF